MRHDSHFVERLAARPASSVGLQIPIDVIDPSPFQPRQAFDGIEELISSIKEKGVLEPILVRRQGSRYQIIAGERRFRAAREAGLTNVPCIELDVDDRGCLEISLVENIQRRDLTPFEEADALRQLKEQFDYTHDQIARQLGRSRTTITETLSLATIPARIRNKCRKAGIAARSTLLHLARLSDEKAMERMIAAIQDGGLSRDDVRRLLREPEADATAEDDGRAQRERGGPPATGFVFRYRVPDRPFTFTLKFPERKKVARKELIAALEEILKELRGAR
jgi:ParB family chromosome partitioning protein